MNARVVGALVAGLVCGLSAGVAGLYLAARQGWLPPTLESAGAVPGSGASSEAHGEEHGAEHADEGGHGHSDEESGHEGETEAVAIDETVMREFGIEVAVAGPGTLRQTVTLPGEVQANQDHLAHIVPRVSGIVREVHVGLGEDVAAGQLMAVIESRELAEAKAAYLAALQRLALAEANLAANEELHRKGVVSDLDFLQARRELADAQIELRAARRRLHAMGLSQASIAAIEDEPETQFAIYPLRAPFEGTVIEKHITLGEVVGPDSDVYVLADLDDVWVMLTVYQKDLPRVRVGQRVTIRSRDGTLRARGTIDYLSPTVDETTRTATARVIIANPDHAWRPGLFVSGQVEVDEVRVGCYVPLSALQQFEGRMCVFVETDEGFVPRPVKLGRRDAEGVEVLAGLRPGERYAARGAFTLKSELLKASFAGAGHGH